MDVKSILRSLNEMGVGDNFLHGLGLEYRRGFFERTFTTIGVFAAGLLVGVGVGVLFAPMRGDELRGRAREGLNEWRNKVMARGEEIGGGVAEQADRPHS